LHGGAHRRGDRAAGARSRQASRDQQPGHGVALPERARRARGSDGLWPVIRHARHRMTASPSIAIVGGGFAGIGLAIALRKAGIDSFTIYERAADVGGVWRDNRYPGAACDVPSRFYSFSFEPDFPWSEAYGRQPEIWDYIKRCVARHDLASKIRFGVNIRH